MFYCIIFIIQKLCKGIHFQLFDCARPPKKKKPDAYSCGPFAIAFAAEMLDAKSPMDSRFDVERVQGYLINCLENKFLIPFSKVLSHLSV